MLIDDKLIGCFVNYLNIGIFVIERRKLMVKKYRKLKSKTLVAKEQDVAYVSPQSGCVNIKERNDIERAISGDELLDRLRPRIKLLFK